VIAYMGAGGTADATSHSGEARGGPAGRGAGMPPPPPPAAGPGSTADARTHSGGSGGVVGRSRFAPNYGFGPATPGISQPSYGLHGRVAGVPASRSPVSATVLSPATLFPGGTFGPNALPSAGGVRVPHSSQGPRTPAGLGIDLGGGGGGGNLNVDMGPNEGRAQPGAGGGARGEAPGARSAGGCPCGCRTCPPGMGAVGDSSVPTWVWVVGVGLVAAGAGYYARKKRIL